MINGSSSDLLEQKLIQKMLDSNRKDSSKNTSTSSRKCDLEVCVDIGDGTTGLIRLEWGSHPLESALEFCKEHNIDESVAPLLAQSILNELKEEENQNRSSLILNHKLSQSMIEEVRPELREITNRVTNLPQNSKAKHTRRRESQTNLTINRSRKRTEPPKEVQQSFNYRPKINTISKQIVQKLNKKNIIQSAEEDNIRKQSKITKIRKENDMKQIVECSFKPKINVISSKVDNEIKGAKHGHRYQQLYMNSFIQQRSKEHSRKTSYEKNTFKPQINKISKTIMTGVSFEQRQEKFRKKALSQSIAVFKPTTGREPKERNVKQLPIGEYLYQKGREKMERRSTQTQNNSRRASIVSNKSEELFNNLKLNKLREVFELLDQKNTGILECDDLDLRNLDSQTLRIFSPIFQEMKEIQVSLNLQEFIEAGSRLIQNLTPQERGILFNTKKKSETPEQFPFHPRINNSRTSLSTVDRERKDIYIRCLMEKKIHKQRIQHSKEELVKSELSECTFKPRINRLEKYVL